MTTFGFIYTVLLASLVLLLAVSASKSGKSRSSRRKQNEKASI